jgi:hypothetical protein
MYRYFAEGACKDLCQEQVLTPKTVAVIKALQHAKVNWLKEVPAAALPELLRYQENRVFREKLESFTKELEAVSPPDMDRIVREVAHGLNSLVQGHHKTLAELHDRYRPKFAGMALAGLGGGFLTGGVAVWLPYLSPSAQALATHAVGTATSVGVMAGAAGAYLKERMALGLESRRAARSLLGVLAVAKHKSRH